MATAKVKFLGFHHKEGDGKYRSGYTTIAGVSAGETFEVPDRLKDGRVEKTGAEIAATIVADYADLGPSVEGKPTAAFAIAK